MPLPRRIVTAHQATGMGIAVTVVMVISTLVTSLLQNYVLVPLQMEYMQTILFILVIAALVQMLEIIMKKEKKSSTSVLVRVL